MDSRVLLFLHPLSLGLPEPRLPEPGLPEPRLPVPRLPEPGLSCLGFRNLVAGTWANILRIGARNHLFANLDWQSNLEDSEYDRRACALSNFAMRKCASVFCYGGSAVSIGVSGVDAERRLNFCV